MQEMVSCGENASGAVKNTYLFEKCPIPKAVLRLALPTIISQIILVDYNMADTFFIGLSGSDAKLTAATICMPAFMILSAIANLFGIGGASVISRALGKNKLEKARGAASFAFWGCLSVVICYACLLYFLRDPILNALGGRDPLVHAYASTYLLWAVVIGGTVTSLNSLFGHLIRSEGRALHAGVGIVLGGVLNMAFDPLFMFVILPRGQEVLGAAIATFLSNLIATVYFLVVLWRHRKQSVLRLAPSRAMFGKSIVAGVLLTGLPACLMTLFENISYAVLDNLMSGYGINYQAGVGVAKKINMLAHSIVRGMSQGVLPLIAYNYAKKNLKRMNHTLYLSALSSITIATVCMAVSMVFSNGLVSLFIKSGSDAVVFGGRFLKILALGAPFSAWAYAVISYFQATKRSMRSFVLAIMRKGVLDIPLMFFLNHRIPVYGIVWATPVADIACAVAALVLFLVFRTAMRRKYGTTPSLDAPLADGATPSEIPLPVDGSELSGDNPVPFDTGLSTDCNQAPISSPRGLSTSL